MVNFEFAITQNIIKINNHEFIYKETNNLIYQLYESGWCVR
jgi:hypothetical protein